MGEPREEFEKGVEHEHCNCSDSSEEFTTSNYGVTTTPRTEFNLVVSGGDGLERRVMTMGDGSEVEHVVVSATKMCRRAEQAQVEDLRVIRKIEDYGKFDSEAGYLVCDEGDAVCSRETFKAVGISTVGAVGG